MGLGRWGASYITQIRLLADRSLKSQRLEKMNKDNFVHYLATGIITGPYSSHVSAHLSVPQVVINFASGCLYPKSDVGFCDQCS